MEKAKKATTVKKAKTTTKTTKGAPLAHGVGRRKSSVARVWLRRGGGSITVNGKESNSYFDTDVTRRDVQTPFRVLPQLAKSFDILVNVKGGGSCSQAGAARLGIARALVSNDEELRIELRKHGLLTVDSRLKERKKYGQKGARAKFQFVKR